MKSRMTMNGVVFEDHGDDHSRDRDRLKIAIRSILREAANDASDYWNRWVPAWEIPYMESRRAGQAFIDTRVSRNPHLNENGGDYDHWVVFSGSRRWTHLREEWSAEWDRLEFGGNDCSYRIPFDQVDALIEEVRQELWDSLMLRKF
jgi:hypothetical protein